jgi:membrane-associated phospholipid phosphatase
MYRVFFPLDSRTALAAGELRKKLATWPCLAPALALILCGIAALSVDVPLARRAHDHAWPKAVADLLQRFEVFGYGVTAGVILLVPFLLDPDRRRQMPRMILIVFGAGLTANIVKLLQARIRPRDFSFEGGVWDTFGPLLTLGNGGSKFQSFPSAHTAVAVALAVGLSALYPRGRWLFTILAVLAASQRVVGGAHYPSDVFWGAAVGWLFAVGVGQARLGGLGFRRWEDDSRSEMRVAA